MDFFKTKLKPVELNIESAEKFSEQRIRIRFRVRFEIVPFLGRKLRFESTGVVIADDKLDEYTLTNILRTTDYQRFVELNMKRRDIGRFDYEYSYNNNSLAINFTTF